jgi:hypothetical protein
LTGSSSAFPNFKGKTQGGVALDDFLSAGFDEQMQNTLAKPLSRPDQTSVLTRGVVRLFVDLGLSPLEEFRLANGRRADVAGIDRAGLVTIVEVKSCRADYECDGKWAEYLGFCDRFFFAVDETFPIDLLPQDEGLILADRYGAAIRKPSQERKLVPARRKAVTLRFARQAALRLSGSAVTSA